VQRFERSFVLEASPAEVWQLFFPPAPPDLRPGEMQVVERDGVRIEILHGGNEIHEGLVRHCYYPVPKLLLSGGVAQSWELVTDVVPNVSCHYRAITRPPFAFAEGWQSLHDLGDGTTRVDFRESYSISNPLMRMLLERLVHAKISRDNGAMFEKLQSGIDQLRAASAEG
jgi:hypothetical protein